MYEDAEKDEPGSGGTNVGGPAKTCVVCSDRALSCNFGAITCESCKAFFRRHAHKEIYGQCDGTCAITVETRSYCRRCRLAKCFSIGMKKELILSDEQKQRRRQKILDNRSKRQSQEVCSADSTGIQDISRMASDHPTGSMDMLPDTVSPGHDPRLAWGTQIPPQHIPMTPTEHYMSSSVPKRDIWESMGGRYPSEDPAKRPAFESVKMASMEDGMGKKDHYEQSFDPGDGSFMRNLPPTPTPNLPPTPYSGMSSPTAPMQMAQMSLQPSGNHPNPNPHTTTKDGYTSKVDPPREREESTKTQNTKPMETSESAAANDLPDGLHPGMFEPCFFGLHPPSCDTVAFSRLEKDVQILLLTATEAYRELCRPMMSIHDKPKPQDYVTLLNRGEECYRQLVRFSKRLPEFRALSQDDQIALLKGNVIEIMIIRFSKCYNLKKHSWVFSSGGDVQTYSGVVENAPVVSAFCLEDYTNFVAAALEASEGDDMILIMLKVITLFWPEVPNIEDKVAITESFNQYNKALEMYVISMYPQNSDMMTRIREVIQQLRTVGKKLHDVMWKSQVEDLHPLLKEMFDLG